MATYNEKEIPDSNVHQKGRYLFKITDVEKSGDGEPLQYNVKMTFTAPEKKVGQKYTERFRLGTDTDPDAEAPETKRSGMTGINWSRWMELTKKAGVFCGDTDEEAEALKGCELGGVMSHREGKDKETKEPTGRIYNSIVRYFEEGKMEPGLDEEVVLSAEAGKAAAAGSPAKAPAKGAAKSGTNPTPSSDAKKKCDHEGCGKMVPARLFEKHTKMHADMDAASGDEE